MIDPEESNFDNVNDIIQGPGGFVDDEDDEIRGDSMFCGDEKDIFRNSERTIMYTSRRITPEQYELEGKRSREIIEERFRKLLPLVEQVTRTKAYRNMMHSERVPSSSPAGRRNDRRYHSSSSVDFNDDSDGDNNDGSDDNLSDSQTINLFSSRRRDSAGRRSVNTSRNGSSRRNSFGNKYASGRNQFRGGMYFLDSLFGVIFIALALGYLFYTYVWSGHLNCYYASNGFELIERGCFDKFRQGFANGAYCSNEVDSLLNNTYLHTAAKVGAVDVGEFLVKKHPDLVDKQNFAGDTPLHIAVRKNQFDFVKFLIENNADCSIENKRERSPKDGSKSQDIDKYLEGHCKQTADPVQPPPEDDFHF